MSDSSPLALHIDQMCGALDRLLAGLASSVSEVPPLMGEAARQLMARAIAGGHAYAQNVGAALPDMLVAERFRLAPIELALLWLAVAPHVEPNLVEAIRRANDDVREDRLDVSLALRLFAFTRDEQLEVLRALAPDAPLLRAGLLEVCPRSGQPNRLRAFIDPAEHLVSLFFGARTLSPTARPFADWVRPTLESAGHFIDSGLAVVLRRALSRLQRYPGDEGIFGVSGYDVPAGGLLVVEGERGVGRTTALKALAGDLRRDVIVVEGPLLAQAAADEQRRALASIVRDAELLGELVVIRDAERQLEPNSAIAPWLAELVRQRQVLVAACVAFDQALDTSVERVLVTRHRMQRPGHHDARHALWLSHMPPHIATPPDELEALADKVQLTPLQVRKAVQLAHVLGDEEADGRIALDARTLERAARMQLGRGLGRMATLSEPSTRLGDVVVEDKVGQQLLAIIAAVRDRRKVLDEWGLGRRIRRGIGVVALFDGEPGTGKTHAAEAIAGELGLSLLQIDIASVVDKYIGETEKHLTRIFESARPDTSLLLFDEADSLFGKRTSEVERAADRYSNMDINVLLQLIERFPGVAILTTNLKRSIDKAFERRFSFKINFPLPGPAERDRIWRYFLPMTVTTGEPIDFEALAAIELSGGEIKNAVMAGAYRAARDQGLLTTAHLIAGAEREAAATGRLIRSNPT